MAPARPSSAKASRRKQPAAPETAQISSRTRAKTRRTDSSGLELLELPDVIISHLLRYLESAELAQAARVCRSIREHVASAVFGRAALLGFRLPELRRNLHRGECGAPQPAEALTHALRFVEAVAARPRALVGADTCHTVCVRPADGAVYSWGGQQNHTDHDDDNEEQEDVPLPEGFEDEPRCRLHHLGHGRAAGRPVRLPTRMVALGGHRIVEVAAGYEHSLLLSEDGRVLSCGIGDHGRLGHGGVESCGAPRVIESIAAERVVQVVAGGFQSLCLTADGGAWSWGWGESGSIGQGSREHCHAPKRIAALDGVRVAQASAGSGHSLFVSEEGALYACGDHRVGKLGLGAQISEDVLAPQRVRFRAKGVVRVRQASAWHMHSLVVTTAGALYSFGCGDDGRLGHGDQVNKFIPCRVRALNSKRVRSCCAGELHSVVQTEGGEVLSFGFGWHGQTGHADLLQQLLDGELPPPLLTPRRITALPADVVEVAVGDHHTVVRLASGGMLAFGANTEGQIGDATQFDIVRAPCAVALPPLPRKPGEPATPWPPPATWPEGIGPAPIGVSVGAVVAAAEAAEAAEVELYAAEAAAAAAAAAHAGVEAELAAAHAELAEANAAVAAALDAAAAVEATSELDS